MHPHLHTKNAMACEEIVAALDECHQKGFMFKASGGCNDIKQQLDRCFEDQRHKVQAENRMAAKAKREKWKETKKDLGF